MPLVTGVNTDSRDITGGAASIRQLFLRPNRGLLPAHSMNSGCAARGAPPRGGRCPARRAVPHAHEAAAKGTYRKFATLASQWTLSGVKGGEECRGG